MDTRTESPTEGERKTIADPGNTHIPEIAGLFTPILFERMIQATSFVWEAHRKAMIQDGFDFWSGAFFQRYMEEMLAVYMPSTAHRKDGA